MELPKNIIQIGEANPGCRIYVEDYVISYIKQWNGHALDKPLAVGLYGTKKEEAGISYLFCYGACRLEFLQKESRHLSQAVLQEAERARKKYFAEYEFLGYRILDGEMVEGFDICEQGISRYITGYAQFYEKNDSMLQLMLEERQEEVKPEEFDQQKYEAVKRRQEERRQRAHGGARRDRAQEEDPQTETKKTDVRFRRMKLTAASLFALLCVAGLTTVNGGEKLRDLQSAVSRLVADMSERQLPDAAVAADGAVQVGTVVAEDRLTDAILKENAAAQTTDGARSMDEVAQLTDGSQSAEGVTQLADGSQSAEGMTQPADGPQGAEGTVQPAAGTQDTEGVTQPADGTQGAEGVAQPADKPTEEAPAHVSYTIRKGDTLIGICLARYGSEAKVAEICTLNGISNPDDIKIGQKILLPQ